MAILLMALSFTTTLIIGGRPQPLPAGILGAPGHFDGLQASTQFLSVSRECSVTGAKVDFEVVRRAARPACFHVGGLMSEAECDHIIAAADAAGMTQAKTAGGDARSGCGAAWLSTKSDEVASTITATCEQLFLQPAATETSDWSDGGRWENMQVLKYQKDGEFRLHYDANEQTHRILTVLLYLNGVGETWFPLALQDARDADAVASANPPRQTALDAACRLKPGRDGLLVAPRKGDAVAFYNHVDNGSGKVDRLALHAGLPAPGEKSVAALWYHVDLRLNDGLQPLAVGVGSQAKSYKNE